MSTIVIEPHTKIEDIQDWFFATFEFLKIVFYSSTNNELQSPSKIAILDPSIELKNIGFDRATYAFEINENDTITTAQKKFKAELNLNAKILRKTNNIWLESTTSNATTLIQQMAHASNTILNE